ncbi:MAG: ATP-binding protein [Microbacteriaceae bacterium]
MYGNLVFGAGPQDCWALYRVHTTSYAGLSGQAKHDVFGALAGFAYSVGSDFQILRVSRPWSVDAYRDQAQAGIDRRHADPRRVERYLDDQVDGLDWDGSQPEVFVAVALTPAVADGSWLGWLGELAFTVGLRDARGTSRRALDELRVGEQRAFACISDFLDCDRADAHDAAWLVSRSLCRCACEPMVDPFWTPQALIVDDEDGGEQLIPLEASVLSLADAPIVIEPRGLTIETEDATSYQALLTVGALPEVVGFPGRQAEVLFAPLEAVDFDVDAVVSARWIGNDQAVALARRKLVDADNAFRDEADGDHGPTASGAVRPGVARELEDYLTGPDRPPLLRASIGLCVGAASAAEREERVATLRREYAPIALHRPLGSQLQLFVSHLPGQRCRVRDYDDVLTCEQLGAMVPTATHAVGSQSGMVIGHVLSGAGRPVRFDLTEASRTSRPGAVLCAGTLGSGKTITAQLLAYQALLRGSRVVTIDPKGGGDHRLDELLDPGEVEIVELSADHGDTGRLDPLRIAPAATRGDLAYSFLTEVLPSPVPAEWQTEIRAAVNAATAAGSRRSLDILDRLEDGNEAARAAGRALRVHADGGLLGLAFATQESTDGGPAAGRALTVLRIANLTLPLPGTPHAEMHATERASRAVLSLLSSYALALLGDDRSRHKVLIVDEAWVLLGDAVGRSLVERMNRLCRSLNVTPILATQVLADTADLQALISAAFLFGVSSDDEAGQALRFAGLDDDASTRGRQRAFRHGRCLMVDYDGRCAPVQITPGQVLLERLDTTPGGQPALFSPAAA